MPLRPGYGTQGRPILLLANYFEIAAPRELVLFQYSIDVLPDTDGKKPSGRLLRRIVELLIKEHVSPNGNDIATDYKSFLLSTSASTIKDNEKDYRIRYLSEGEDEPSANAKSYRVRLRFTKALQMSDLIDYLTSSNARKLFESKQDMIQAMNIILGHWPKTASGIVSVGANKHFDNTDIQTLQGGLIAIRGLFVSVRTATSRLLVNAQIQHGAFYNAIPLPALMAEYTSRNNGTVRLGIFLKRLHVRVTHIINKKKNGQIIPRFRTIFSLATPQDGRKLDHPPKVKMFGAGAKDVMFHWTPPAATGVSQGPAKPTNKSGKAPRGGSASSAGTYISVYDFFRRVYNITIKDPALPVVNVGNRENPVYLPADVCVVVAGQPSSAKLSDVQTQKMVSFAVRGPAMNAASIIASAPRLLGLETPANTTLNSFGVQMTPELITVQGRLLQSPPVKYRDGKLGMAKPDGSWNMINIKFAEGGKVDTHKWTWLSLSMKGKHNPLKGEQLVNVLKSFHAKMKEVGVDVGNPTNGLEYELMGPNLDAEIDTQLRRFVSRANVEIDLLIVILPYADTSIYNSIKRGCDIRYGLRHVCVTAAKFGRPENHQYFANVALKVNLKLGGRNQQLDANKLGIISEGRTMVVGIDVTHPSPGSASNAPSVAGIVASVDKLLGQWPADLQIQTAKKEMVSGSKDFV
jgi:eukaryotic translation initiation factor 2C